MLWAVFTLIAAAAQTARNAMQRELTATLGTVAFSKPSSSTTVLVKTLVTE